MKRIDKAQLAMLKEYILRQRAYGRAPNPWQANGFTMDEILLRKADRKQP